MAYTRCKIIYLCKYPVRKSKSYGPNLLEKLPLLPWYAFTQNEYGSFIGMKLMRFIKNEDDPFYQEIKNNFILLSQTEKGLNVIKAFISELKDAKGQAKIVDIIKTNSISYIEDPYSNYAFQNIIKQWPLVITQPLFPLLCNNIMRFSVQQCSSNVVETLLYNAPIEFRKNYIQEIIHLGDISSMFIIKI